MSTETITEQAQHKVVSLADNGVDSKDSEVRYMAYASRLRTALRASSRYIAYTSDIGEAFRPVVSPRIVAAAYGISWAYLLGDVSYEAYKAHRQGPTPLEATNFSEPTRVGLVAVQRGVFQAVASMGLPALTIHTVVRQTTKIYAKNAKSARVKAWGPTLTGLAVVPLLPYLFDKPVEHVTDVAFDWMKQKWYEKRTSSSKINAS
ncbi:hypothetical protein K439DRAFT_1389949 [Ramaria rubella]|nr:hypothetical protein K439DRAFT_1389949 [Ramaria rubella]